MYATVLHIIASDTAAVAQAANHSSPDLIQCQTKNAAHPKLIHIFTPPFSPAASFPDPTSNASELHRLLTSSPRKSLRPMLSLQKR